MSKSHTDTDAHVAATDLTRPHLASCHAVAITVDAAALSHHTGPVTIRDRDADSVTIDHPDTGAFTVCHRDAGTVAIGHRDTGAVTVCDSDAIAVALGKLPGRIGQRGQP